MGHRRKKQHQSIRRRPRRQSRRQKKRGAIYSPIVTDVDAATRGVRHRLYGASFAALMTFICILSCVFLPMTTFTMFVLVSFAMGTLSTSIAMLLSARREELVHQLASDLHEQILLEYEGDVGNATDGTI